MQNCIWFSDSQMPAFPTVAFYVSIVLSAQFFVKTATVKLPLLIQNCTYCFRKPCFDNPIAFSFIRVAFYMALVAFCFSLNFFNISVE